MAIHFLDECPSTRELNRTLPFVRDLISPYHVERSEFLIINQIMVGMPPPTSYDVY